MIGRFATRLLEVPSLLRGDLDFLRRWVTHRSWGSMTVSVTVILLGTGVFGAALGSWRAPMQALYGGVKLPMVLLLTALFNGLINALFAPLLGLNISLRTSLAAVLASFANGTTQGNNRAGQRTPCSRHRAAARICTHRVGFLPIDRVHHCHGRGASRVLADCNDVWASLSQRWILSHERPLQRSPPSLDGSLSDRRTTDVNGTASADWHRRHFPATEKEILPHSLDGLLR